HKQPLTVANTHVAQKVKQTERPWVGRVFSRNQSSADDQEDGDDIEGYPYAIVPIMESSNYGSNQVKGLIRVLSFDSSREISAQDLSTLKLMGEHLSSKLPHASEMIEAEQKPEEERGFVEQDCVLIVHSNRLSRRRYSRILGERYQVLEG